MTVDQYQQCLERTRQYAHARCIACGSSEGDAPRLRFTPGPDGDVTATLQPSPHHEGYDGMLHGGIIATLLDAAMTNCLFAHGQCGVTAELQVRYRHPVAIDEECRLRAWIERSSPPLYLLRAELRQGDSLRATAHAKFMVKEALDT